MIFQFSSIVLSSKFNQLQLTGGRNKKKMFEEICDAAEESMLLTFTTHKSRGLKSHIWLYQTPHINSSLLCISISLSCEHLKSNMTQTKPIIIYPLPIPPPPTQMVSFSEVPLSLISIPTQPVSQARCLKVALDSIPSLFLYLSKIQVLKHLKLAILNSLFLPSTGTALVQTTVLLSTSPELLEWLIVSSVECPSLNHSASSSRVIDCRLNEVDTAACLPISPHGFPLTSGRILDSLQRLSPYQPISVPLCGFLSHPFPEAYCSQNKCWVALQESSGLHHSR